jgi:hypothetical protein
MSSLAQAGRLWREGDAPHPVGGNIGRPLFRCAVDIGQGVLAVPVNLLLRVGVVMDLDGRFLAFGEAQERVPMRIV